MSATFALRVGMADQESRDVQVRVPFSTLMKIALFLLLLQIIIKLVPLLAMIYVAIMLAVVMAAATTWMEKYHVRRGVALSVIATLIFGSILAFLFLVVPAMFSEMRDLAKEAPAIAKRLEEKVPALAPYIRSVTTQTLPKPEDAKGLMATGAVAGMYAIEAVTAIFLTLVIAVYLVVEGKRALAWLFSFAPGERRRKLAETAEEVEPIMQAYMRGQLITSALAALVALVTLTLLGVRAVVPLAVLAFVGDIVPVLGFIASTVPAALLALLVSPAAALIVVAAYMGYHVVENYIIVPRIYGHAMRLSTLTVLLSVSVGGLVAGPAGAVLILPLVAAYPAIERIWLTPHLAADTIPKHDAIEGDDQRKSERATDAVMKS